MSTTKNTAPGANKTAISTEAVRSFTTATSAKALQEMLKKYGLIPGQQLKATLKTTSSTKIIMITIFILLLQGVFGYFSQAGADYVMDKGRMISIFVTMIGAAFVIITALKVLPSKPYMLRWVVVGAELVLMSYNAYVMPGFFGQASIGTQAEQLIAEDVQNANDALASVGAFYSLNNMVHNSAVNIAEIEEQRDGKGIVYGTATGIAKGFPAVSDSFVQKVKAPKIKTEMNSLADLNKELLAAHESIVSQVNRQLDKAKGVLSAAASAKKALTDLETKVNLPQQAQNVKTIQANIEQMETFSLSEYKSAPITIKKSGLRIDGFLRVLPFILDFIVVMMILFLVVTVYADTQDNLDAAIAESQILGLEKILQNMKIRFKSEDITVDDEHMYALEYLEANPGVKDAINKNGFTYTQYLSLRDQLSESGLTEQLEGGSKNISKLKEMLSIAKDETGINTDILQKISNKDWQILYGVFENGATQIAEEFDTVRLKYILQIIKTLKLRYGNDIVKTAKAMNKIMVRLDNDIPISIFEIWGELVEQFESEGKLNAITSSLLFNLKKDDDLLQAFVEIVKATRNDATAAAIMNQWSKSSSEYMIELKASMLYSETLRAIFKKTAKADADAVAKIFAMYEKAKGTTADSTSMQEVVIKVNSNPKYYTDLMNTIDITKLKQQLETVFVVDNTVA